MIFSKVSEVRCFDLESELAHSSWPKDLDLGRRHFSFKLTSDVKEFDNDGTRDVVGGDPAGVTHNDSLDQTRQLMFS
jgi:hypothetical protein